MWRSRTDCVCAQAKSRGGSTVLAWSTACGKILLRRHEIPVAQAEEKEEEEPGMKYPSSMSTIVQETLDSLPSKTKESSTGLWKLGRPLAARQPFAHPLPLSLWRWRHRDLTMWPECSPVRATQVDIWQSEFITGG